MEKSLYLCNCFYNDNHNNKDTMDMVMNSDRNIKDVARYLGISLLYKNFSVSPLKLQKILYYTQSWYMVIFGEKNTLFKECPQAWVNGPVYPTIYHEYKNKVAFMSHELSPANFDCTEETLATEAQSLAEKMRLTDDEIKCIDSILMLYGSKTQDQLVFLSHCEDPWVKNRGSLQPYEYSDKEISLKEMHDYYRVRYDNNRKNKQ